MKEASPSDAVLLESARAGDLGAFERLMRAHLDAVYGHALRFFGDHATAEDAAQEVWVKVYRSMGDFDGRAAFSTWLYRVTRNVCLDMFRRGKRQASPIDPLDLPQTPSGEFADAAATSADLERAVAALPPEDRDAFNAVALFGLTYADAGTVLGVPPGTVKSRVFRARRTIIGRLGLGPGGDA
ncbi:MAG: RNA polymerase sigma factor [Coriobacteriia bacterium]|jgi:RNA polymerase sigma-70 factor (ECF subfamily)|nr:RNA polymerase sigma factor [Coriobacteriia bacterium]